MSLMLIGSKGQLGREVHRKCVSRGVPLVAVDLPEVDITDFSRVERLFEESRPSIAINAAAYTAVDLAESESRACYAVNRDGPLNLARACAEGDIPLIHISTDYVFDGKAGSPYRENDPVRPLGVYGRSKAEGERAVASGCRKHVVVRTAWLYGVFGKNFVKTMLRAGMERDCLKVVNDQFGCPTCAADLADAVLAVCASVAEETEGKKDGKPWGVYHYCGKGIATWYELAKEVFEIWRGLGAGKIPELIPISTSEYPTAAERPRFSALDCSGMERTFGVRQVPWRDSLRKTVEEIIAGGTF